MIAEIVYDYAATYSPNPDNPPFLERSKEEHSEAYRIAQAIDADRERCVAAFLGAIALIGIDLEAAVGLARDAVEWSRRRGLVWAERFASTIDGIVQAVAGDIDTAHARYSRGLEVQRKLGDEEGAGLSLGGLAQLAAIRGDLPESLELYRQSLAAFEAIGDRAEEARILSETAWTHLRNEDAALARRYFIESVQAYIDVASVRGVGLSLIGLAATEMFEQRFETAVTLAAAAEVYAHEEGIVNVYSDETPGREFVDRAREALSADEVARATEAGRGLTIKKTLDLARTPNTTPVWRRDGSGATTGPPSRGQVSAMRCSFGGDRDWRRQKCLMGGGAQDCNAMADHAGRATRQRPACTARAPRCGACATTPRTEPTRRRGCRSGASLATPASLRRSGLRPAASERLSKRADPSTANP